MIEDRSLRIFAPVVMLLFLFSIFLLQEPTEDSNHTYNPISKQTIVCDEDYGVEYFQYKGRLTLRVDKEGNPVECQPLQDKGAE
jgi:hypothetical protein